MAWSNAWEPPAPIVGRNRVINGRNVIVTYMPDHSAPECRYCAKFLPRRAHDLVGWGKDEATALSELQLLDDERIEAGL